MPALTFCLRPPTHRREAHIHVVDPTLCPKPCMPVYKHYSTPTYRSHPHAMKGISYGPAPLKVRGAALLGDDFMADIPSMLWADWGRGDLAIMKDDVEYRLPVQRAADADL